MRTAESKYNFTKLLMVTCRQLRSGHLQLLDFTVNQNWRRERGQIAQAASNLGGGVSGSAGILHERPDDENSPLVCTRHVMCRHLRHVMRLLNEDCIVPGRGLRTSMPPCVPQACSRTACSCTLASRTQA